ncbi:MAG: hypothetical protein FWE82_04395 [Defluviitaleaceae bacterium]|nr:hypothetical protein [Defluviitaleaceae bacterium]
MMSDRENFFRTVKFLHPDCVRSNMIISDAMWACYKTDLERVVLRHPTVFPHYKTGTYDFSKMNFSFDTPDNNYKTDPWGCMWHYPLRYMDGVVVSHPLSDMDTFDAYVPPESPVPDLTEEEWAAEIKSVNEQKANGSLAATYIDHGFMFLRHTYLRGFDNAMEDYALHPENVEKIYAMAEKYYMKFVQFHIKRGTDFVMFADDLGTQTATIISPEMFRRYLKPAYARLMGPCKKAGIIVGLHSDGKTLDILEDQVAAGVDVVNPQDFCNGIDELARRIKGKACIQLDIDRQTVLPYGTPKDIDDLIREEIEKLGAPEGGLILVCGLYPPTPPENVEALAIAIEKYRTMWTE